MVLDNFVEAEIEGAKYKLCLNNKCAFMAERELASGKLLSALADPPLSMGDLFTLFKWALIGGGHKLDEDQIFNLFILKKGEIGDVAFFNIILEVLKKSELIGKNRKAAKKA